MSTQKEIFDDLGVFVSANLISRNTKNGAKPYIEVLYTPVLSGGKTYQGEPYKRGAFQDSLKGSQSALTSLREGDAVTLKVVLNGKFRNLVGVQAGHVDTPHRSPSTSRVSSGSFSPAPKTDYNERAAKGQALNLAMTVAISEGKATDDSYILSLVPRMLALGEAVQNGNTQPPTSGVVNELQGSSTSVQTRTSSTTGTSGHQESGVSTNGNSPSTVTDVGTALDDSSNGLLDVFSDVNNLFGPL